MNTHYYRRFFSGGCNNISTDLCNLEQFILAVENHFWGGKREKLWEASKINLSVLNLKRKIMYL